MEKSKVYQIIKGIILISPFILLVVAIYQNKNNIYWTPPVFEIIALGLLIFSNLYLLIEWMIMRSKKEIKKVNTNFFLIALCTLAFLAIVYFYDLWR
ncbi:hypothetical protein [Aquimarina algicola]|uniref:Uncharacterized protein n=1 Tax=Aquimarina algicola TaxID=2589995 RepID=A0A504JII5_9FLAO|nr:hypothetical protein [Aquimarina algicola]TPN86311.1 hypothetical protein FHK87_13675 [Aquimarina algicola]